MMENLELEREAVELHVAHEMEIKDWKAQHFLERERLKREVEELKRWGGQLRR